MVTAVLQILVVYISGSVALLADTIHNFGDAATAIPLGFAFILARRKANKRFTYGYGEGLAWGRNYLPDPLQRPGGSL
ncbi:Cobalt-zinc-cadmium resistance protein [Methanosarcina siciliae C2J]|uniref:Cobalt-zinc-cadmium resistance protein n=1 Tax=Methanosarcina siciliae C2J TaxID=1434118 RepID=A0A0E3PKL5_9EURY|nr:cation transporter [Methanosarcina siciliae]AKB34928.1 Cobalt-zinc-cadmium resistance protein [Methanosarcina siciliae C2J]